jgi:hypothetical protein
VKEITMAKATKAAFEKSGFDKDTKKAPEGSKADTARDKKQFGAFKKSQGFKRGGKVK